MKKTLALVIALAIGSGQTQANSCSSGYGSVSPYQQTGYGGVSLSKTASILLKATDIEGAAYDQATGQIIFYGKQNTSLPEMHIDDLAVAVRSIYGMGDKSPQNPGVSINTESSEIPGQVKVRYDGATQDTRFGLTMFDADRLLKGLTIGEDNETGQPISSNLPGFKSYFDLMFESNLTDGNFHERVWFEPEKVILKRSSNGDSMVFDEVKMKVLAKARDANTGEEMEPSQPGIQFSTFLTENYDAISDEYPVLKELKRLGKITAVVKWIQENNIPLDLSFLEEYSPELVNTPDYTNKHTVVRQSGNRILTTEGGIKYFLNEDNFSQNRDAQADAIMQTAIDGRPNEGEFYWDFTQQGEQYIAIAQSLTKSKKDGNFAWNEVDLSYPAPGDLSLTFIRYYDSFNEHDIGFGKGWYATPFGVRFPGKLLELTFGAEPAISKVAHYDFYIRVGNKEELYTVSGLTADQNVVYLSESKLHQVVFDEANNLYKYTNHGINQTVSFDLSGKLTQITDKNGLSLRYNYIDVDGQSILDSIAHSSRRKISLIRNSSGQITQTASPGGKATSYTYDSNKRLVKVKISSNTSTQYSYNNYGLLNKVKNSAGNIVASVSYDDYNRAHNVAFGTTSSQQRNFDLAARKTTVSNEKGLDTTSYYDSKYRLLTAYDGLSRQIDFEYQSSFGPTRQVDPRGSSTSIVYDSRGNINELSTHYEDKWRSYYNTSNLLNYIQNPLGNGVYYTYDRKGRVLYTYHNAQLEKNTNGAETGQILYDPNNKTEYEYDLSGNATAYIDPRGKRWEFTYNSDGLLITSKTPSGRTTSREYDQHARLERIYDSFGDIVSYQYDDNDRVTSTIVSGSKVVYTYNANGNVATQQDARGFITYFHYDEDDRLVQVTDAIGGQTTYQYDHSGNLKSITLPNGEIRETIFDIANRPVQEIAGL